MLRRLAMPGFVICIILSLVTLLLWVRGLFYCDVLYADYSAIVSLESGRSAVELTYVPHNLHPHPHGSGWYAQTVQPNDDVWNGLHDFSWANSRVRLPLGIRRETTIAVPIWLFTALSAATGYAFLLGRGKRQMRVRRDLQLANPRLRRRVGRFAVFSVTGAALGWFVARLGLGSGLYEDGWGLVACLPVPFMTAVIVLTRRRIRWSKGALWMTLELAGGTCFFAAVVEQIWHAANHYDERNPLLMSFLFGIVCFICGSVALLLLQMRTEAKKSGVYCPVCGYCLIGVPNQICPECGRPFTLEELGITPDALVPPVPSLAEIP